MEKTTSKNIRLGIFVLLAITFLVVMLYAIGDGRNLFGRSFSLKAEFRDVNGLMEGNNVRFAGIDVGTVKKIEITDDSTVTVEMVIDEEYKKYIRKNAIATISTDGLMGNKLLNILTSSEPSKGVDEGDVLQSLAPVDAGEMIRTLKQTNDNLANITNDVRNMTERFNNPNNLWSMLMDSSVSKNLKKTISNIKVASNHTQLVIANMNELVKDVRHGKGSIGKLINDTTLAGKINNVADDFNALDDSLSVLLSQLNEIASGVKNEKGSIGALIRDTVILDEFKQSLENIKKGADNFNQNMEALKRNVLFRRYFRKEEKRKMKEQKKNN